MSDKKNNKDNKTANSKAKKDIKNKKEQKKITIQDLSKMSDIKKLYILRESIDLLALGIPVNQEVIDYCFEDLLEALQDYKYVTQEFEHNLETKYFNSDTNVSTSDNGVNAENGINTDVVTKEISLEELTKSVYGESWDKLLEGLDELNEKHGTYYQAYMYPNIAKQTVKLKIYDDHDVVLKRVYDDKYDLDLNLDNDIKTNFKGPKIKLSNLKLDLKHKENNKE